MEEILSSIRRIIADDQEAAQGASGPSPEAGRAGSPDVRNRSDEADVLDLAEIGARPSPPPNLDLDVPEISFSEEDDRPDSEPVETDAPMQATMEADRASRPLQGEPGQPAPDSGPLAADAPPHARLVSATTDASVNHAFNMLAHTVLSNNARTLEDLVKEMLRPMLKVWLDDNLPGMVERLVRAEIERVARGGR